MEAKCTATVVNLCILKVRRSMYFILDSCFERKASHCSSSVLMFFCLKQSMEKVEEQFLFVYLQWDYKKIKEYGIKTRFLKNKVIFKVFLETSSFINLK